MAAHLRLKATLSHRAHLDWLKATFSHLGWVKATFSHRDWLKATFSHPLPATPTPQAAPTPPVRL